MNPELINRCMGIYIARAEALSFISFWCLAIFVVYSIYQIIKISFEEADWERRQKKHWDHIKEVQDRFKDDDLKKLEKMKKNKPLQKLISDACEKIKRRCDNGA